MKSNQSGEMYLGCLFANTSLFEVGFFGPFQSTPSPFLTFKKNHECQKIHPRAPNLRLDMTAAFFSFLRNHFPSETEEVNVAERADDAFPGSPPVTCLCDVSPAIGLFSELLLRHRSPCWGAPNTWDLAVPKDFHSRFWRSTFLEISSRMLDTG